MIVRVLMVLGVLHERSRYRMALEAIARDLPAISSSVDRAEAMRKVAARALEEEP